MVLTTKSPCFKTLVGEHEKFTNEVMEEFRWKSDYLYHNWVKQYSAEGLINYILDMIEDGHIADFY